MSAQHGTVNVLIAKESDTGPLVVVKIKSLTAKNSIIKLL